MSRPLHRRILIGLLVIGTSMACRVPFTRVLQPETETPSPVPAVSQTETPFPTAIPTNIVIPTASRPIALATATPKFAPFCQPSSASVLTPTPFQCEIPLAEQSSAYCSNKVPYNLIVVNEGSTYESLSENIECSDADMIDGKQFLTCTGPMGFPFELRVCDPACAIPTFPAGTSNCPQGYSFNDLLNCCEQAPQPLDQNCVTLSLQTRRCVTDCSEFTSRSTCEQNFYACEWDAEHEVCQVRK